MFSAFDRQEERRSDVSLAADVGTGRSREHVDHEGVTFSKRRLDGWWADLAREYSLGVAISRH